MVRQLYRCLIFLIGCNHLSFPQQIQTGDTVNLFQGCGRDAGGEIVAIVRMVKPFENFAAISDPCW